METEVFLNAARDVLYDITGVLPELSEEERLAPLNDIVALMQLSTSGILLVHADESTLRALCSRMTGEEESEVLPDELRDMASELANIIAGNAKTKAMERYILTSPIVITGTGMNLSLKKRANQTAVRYSAGTLSVGVRLLH